MFTQNDLHRYYENEDVDFYGIDEDDDFLDEDLDDLEDELDDDWDDDDDWN